MSRIISISSKKVWLLTKSLKRSYAPYIWLLSIIGISKQKNKKANFKYGMQRNLVHYILVTVNILRINYNVTIEFFKLTIVLFL